MKYYLALFALVFLLAGCSEKPDVEWLDKDWATIEEEARGTTVRWYMWGGAANINTWVDTYVSSELKKKYNITLERVPMDASVFVNKLLTEKGANKSVGTIDLLWINGENFKNAKEADLLFGPYAEKLPSYKRYVNKTIASTDFGYPTQGYETPYGMAQFVFEYDKAKTPEPPRSFAVLKQWVKDNPGRFTYPQPPDFTGSAFIRQAFYATTGGASQYMHGWDKALFEKNAPKLWAYLDELKPYLWLKGKSYPKTAATLDSLFTRGEVDINMSYHPLHAQGKILDGVYKETVSTFVMEEGAIFNIHFTAIPFNAPNKPGAMVVANFLLSPEAQLSKFDPVNWGDFPALDMNRLDSSQKARFADVDLGEATLSKEFLDAHAVPEIPAAYLEALEKGWEENVLHSSY